MIQFYDFSHMIHLHVWDIPAYIIITICILLLILHFNNMKKQKEKLDEHLEEALESYEIDKKDEVKLS